MVQVACNASQVALRRISTTMSGVHKSLGRIDVENYFHIICISCSQRDVRVDVTADLGRRQKSRDDSFDDATSFLMLT